MTRTILFLVSSLSILGCGDDDVPDDKPINELSRAELMAACEDLSDSLDAEDAQSLSCTFQALILANGDEAMCNQLRAQCLMNPPMSEGGTCDDVSTDGLGTCTATYAEFKACLSKFYDAYAELARSLKCDLADDPDQAMMMQSGASMENIPECQTVETKCPGAFRDREGVDGGT